MQDPTSLPEENAPAASTQTIIKGGAFKISLGRLLELLETRPDMVRQNAKPNEIDALARVKKNVSVFFKEKAKENPPEFSNSGLSATWFGGFVQGRWNLFNNNAFYELAHYYGFEPAFKDGIKWKDNAEGWVSLLMAAGIKVPEMQTDAPAKSKTIKPEPASAAPPSGSDQTIEKPAENDLDAMGQEPVEGDLSLGPDKAPSVKELLKASESQHAKSPKSRR